MNKFFKNYQEFKDCIIADAYRQLGEVCKFKTGGGIRML